MNVKNLIILIFLAEGAFLFASYANEKSYISTREEQKTEYKESEEFLEEEIDIEPIAQNIVLPQSNTTKQLSSNSTDCSKLFGVTFHEIGSEELIKVENGFIDISNKKLEKMPDDIIYEDCISSIDAELNRLEELPNELTQLPRLTFLDLSHNRIKVLHDLKKFYRLKHLDLSHNRIEEIPIDIMTMKELEFLNLKSNYKIEKIPYQIVHLNLSLKRLDLRNTKLARNRDEINELKSLLPHTIILYK